MFLLKLMVLILTFNEFIINLHATACPKGQRVTRGKPGCMDCFPKTFQPTENDSQQCQACTKCNPSSGSVVRQECTKLSNTQCQCRAGFVPRDNDSSTCQCNVGHGLKPGDAPACSECEQGYFSTSINSPCQKWKDCKSAGENVTGTRTSDVICNEESESNTDATTTSTLNKILSPTSRLTSHRPHEGAQTQKTRSTVPTTPGPGHAVTPNKVQPFYPAGNHIGTVLIVFGILGLLVLTAVTCKQHITSRRERQPVVQKNEPLCSSPVEEIGDQSSLKQNQEP